MPATIYDIAKAAGVSIASVSIVIRDNESPRVSEKKRHEILRIARELGYTPNAVAKALSEGSTRIVGLVVPMKEPIFNNPFIADVLTGIQSAVMDYGFHLMVYTHRATTGRLTKSELQQSRLVDGVIAINTRMCSAEDMNATIGDLRATHTKFVMVNGYYGDQPINYVGVDDEANARLAVDYLSEKGHQSIALVTGSPRSPISKHLLSGFRRGLRQHRLATTNLRHANCNYDEALLLETVRGWMREADPPTAIVCADNHVALQLYQVARTLKLTIPDDLSVLGTGNGYLGSTQHPRLTTIAIPAVEIGKRAAILLINSISGDPSPARIILPAQIMPGESA